MANQKLTDKTAFGAILDGLDLIHLVDVSDTTQDPDGSSYKLTLNQLSFFFSGWNVGGNTVGADSAFGTIDNFDVAFITNNTEKMRLMTSGFLGLGWNNPSAKLHIVSSGVTSASAAFFVENSIMTDLFKIYDSGQIDAGVGFNLYMGRNAGLLTSGANYSTAFGIGAISSAETVGYNSSFGYFTLKNVTSGFQNSAFGDEALTTNSTAHNNSAFGHWALKMTTASNNTGIGSRAGEQITTGQGNICIGFQSGYDLTTESDRIVLDNRDRTSLGGSTISSPIYAIADNDVGNQIINLNGRINPGTKATTVNNSVSGTTDFTQVYGGGAYKKVIIYLNAGDGTASFVFPVTFSQTPLIQTNTGLSPAIITSLSTIGVTVTGTVTTGILILEGF